MQNARGELQNMFDFIVGGESYDAINAETLERLDLVVRLDARVSGTLVHQRRLLMQLVVGTRYRDPRLTRLILEMSVVFVRW